MSLKTKILLDKLMSSNGFLNKASKLIKHRKPKMVTKDRPSNLCSENSAKNNTGDIDSWRAV